MAEIQKFISQLSFTPQQRIALGNWLREYAEWNGELVFVKEKANAFFLEPFLDSESDSIISPRIEIPRNSHANRHLLHELQHFMDTRKDVLNLLKRGHSLRRAIEIISEISDNPITDSTSRVRTENNAVKTDGTHHATYPTFEGIRALSRIPNVIEQLEDPNSLVYQRVQKLLPVLANALEVEAVLEQMSLTSLKKSNPLAYIESCRVLQRRLWPETAPHWENDQQIALLKKLGQIFERDYAPKIIKRLNIEMKKELAEMGIPDPQTNPFPLLQAQYQRVSAANEADNPNTHSRLAAITLTEMMVRSSSYLNAEKNFNQLNAPEVGPISDELKAVIYLGRLINEKRASRIPYEDNSSFRTALLINTTTELMAPNMSPGLLDPRLSQIPKDAKEISEWLNQKDWHPTNRLNALKNLKKFGFEMNPFFWQDLKESPQLLAEEGYIDFMIQDKEWKEKLKALVAESPYLQRKARATNKAAGLSDDSPASAKANVAHLSTKTVKEIRQIIADGEKK